MIGNSTRARPRNFYRRRRGSILWLALSPAGRLAHPARGRMEWQPIKTRPDRTDHGPSDGPRPSDLQESDLRAILEVKPGRRS